MNKKLNNKYIKDMKDAVRLGEDCKVVESHRKADHVLCELLKELGYSELIDSYYEVEKWYA